MQASKSDVKNYVTYLSPVWDGKRYVMVMVGGEPINYDIPPFSAGELCVQRQVKTIQPLEYEQSRFIITHIETGAQVSYVQCNRQAAVIGLVQRLAGRTREQIDSHIEKTKNHIAGFMCA